MDKLWKDEGLDLRMSVYNVIATDFKMGLIEVVPNANTVANIQKQKAFTSATSAFQKR
jgi:phosphatidylinositol kinase/protein kinase (PI-3  family)